MKILIAILMLSLVGLRAQESIAASTNSVDPMSFEAFKVIGQRNIFDPNRRFDRGSQPPPTNAAPRRTEAFTLVGSIAYEKGEFAFFEGTSSEYRKSVKAGDSFAGYKVARVTPQHVTFEADGKTVNLPVGAQMKRIEGEEWKINAVVEPIGSSSGGSNGSREARDSSRESREYSRESRDFRREDSRRNFGERDSSRFNSERNGRTTPTAPTTSSESNSGGSQSDALRRLMERRARGE